MYQKAKKLLAAICAIALAATAMPALRATAATTPKFKKTHAVVYENGDSDGKYNFRLINLTKGQTVKWSVDGAGKSYVKFKRASKKAAGSTMLNILYVDTKGAAAAKNKKVTLYAKVYSSAGKLQSTVKTAAKIRVKPTKVTLTVPDEADGTLMTGGKYKFSYALKPGNATTTNIWTVTGSDGKDYSSYIDSKGVFKPAKPGEYTIKIAATIDGKTMKSASAKVKVGNRMESVKQVAANKLELKYSGDVRDTYKAEDFTVQNAAGTNLLSRELSFSTDGTTVTLTLSNNFVDGASYSVRDGDTTKSFTASVGVPKRLKILTSTVTVQKESVIEYAVYDANGVDVTSVYPGSVTYSADVMNGYLTGDNKLYMTEIGKTANVSLTYYSLTGSNTPLTASAQIRCVAAEMSSNTNFTLTTSPNTPDYSAKGYKDNRVVSLDGTYYAHFRALDKDKGEMPYDSIWYESSDPDTLIVNGDEVLPIRVGKAVITVTAEYAGQRFTYAFDVTVEEAARLGSVKLSSTQVTMSNSSDSDYRKYIGVTAYDQRGNAYPLYDETVDINPIGSSLAYIPSYDPENHRVILNASGANAGTYGYELSLASGGHTVKASFAVTVRSVPNSSAVTYAVEADEPTVDLALTGNMSGDKTLNVRLAEYIGGVFSSYVGFEEATVSKAGRYYTEDLTAKGTSSKQSISGGTALTLKLVNVSGDVCKKAETGVYNVTMIPSNGNGNTATRNATFTLTDTQGVPTVRVDRVRANVPCATALELVQNCLSPSSGEITECEVTGKLQPGSSLSITYGESVNIRTVTVRSSYTIADGRKISVDNTINVNRTLRNQ